MKNKMRVRQFRESIESKRLGLWTLLWSVAVIYLLTVAEASFLPFFKIGNAAFDLLLTAGIFLSMYTNECYGAVYGVVTGALFDMLNNSRVPIMPLVFLFMCAYAGTLFPMSKKGSIVRKYTVVIVCTAIRFALTFLLEMGRNSTPLEMLTGITLPSFLCTVLLSPLVMLLCIPARAK